MKKKEVWIKLYFMLKKSVEQAKLRGKKDTIYTSSLNNLGWINCKMGR